MTETTSRAASSPSVVPTADISALFDFSFKRFITLSVMKVLYILFLLLIVISWLGIGMAGFSAGGFWGGVIMLFVGAIVVMIEVIAVRVSLELICVIFRIGENTTALVERGRV